MNEQFYSNNQRELANLIILFRELTDVYNNQFTLYLDKDYWEVFDLRIGKPIFRHKFKELKPLSDNMRRLTHAIIDCGTIRFMKNKQPNQVQAGAVRFLMRLYGEEQLNYFLQYERERKRNN